jgi:hypothetical protein
MADVGKGASASIQFADGIHPAKNSASAGTEGLFEKQSSHDLDEEERARKIAEQDLSQKKKQV